MSSDGRRGELARRCAHLTYEDFALKGRAVIIHTYNADEPGVACRWHIVCDPCHRARFAELSPVFLLPEDLPDTPLA